MRTLAPETSGTRHEVRGYYHSAGILEVAFAWSLGRRRLPGGLEPTGEEIHALPFVKGTSSIVKLSSVRSPIARARKWLVDPGSIAITWRSR